MIYTDMLDTRTMDECEYYRTRMKSFDALPNVSMKNGHLTGFICKSSVLIPTILRDFRQVTILRISETNVDPVMSWVLKSIPLSKHELIEIGSDRCGKKYISLLLGNGVYATAFNAKYDRILGKRKGLLSFKHGTKGYAECIIDYHKVVKKESQRREDIIKQVIDSLGVDVIKRMDFNINGLEFDDGVFEYRNMVGKAGGVGVILGNVGQGVWLCGTKDTIGGYPASLGKPITDSMAGVPVSKQVLELSIGDVDTWIDDEAIKDAPFNYRSIDTIINDSEGAIYSPMQIKPIINIRK